MDIICSKAYIYIDIVAFLNSAHTEEKKKETTISRAHESMICLLSNYRFFDKTLLIIYW